MDRGTSVSTRSNRLRLTLVGVDGPMLLLLFSLGFVLCLPLVLYGLPAGHDGLHHLMSLHHFARQLGSDDWFPSGCQR